MTPISAPAWAVSPSTLKTHIRNILRRLNINSRAGLLAGLRAAGGQARGIRRKDCPGRRDARLPPRPRRTARKNGDTPLLRREKGRSLKRTTAATAGRAIAPLRRGQEGKVIFRSRAAGRPRSCGPDRVEMVNLDCWRYSPPDFCESRINGHPGRNDGFRPPLLIANRMVVQAPLLDKHHLVQPETEPPFSLISLHCKIVDGFVQNILAMGAAGSPVPRRAV